MKLYKRLFVDPPRMDPNAELPATRAETRAYEGSVLIIRGGVGVLRFQRVGVWRLERVSAL